MARAIAIAELARMVKGRISGDFREGTTVAGTCSLDNYVAGKVSFVRKQKYAPLLATLTGAVILIPEAWSELSDQYPHNAYIVVTDVTMSLMDVQDFFYPADAALPGAGISPRADVDATARLGEGVYVGANVHLGKNVVVGGRSQVMPNSHILDDVVIGSNTRIYPGVWVHNGCRIGNDCAIHAGACVGVAGYRVEQDVAQKTVRMMRHAGKVIIGDRVEVKANSTIDRATFEDDATILGDDVKIDNLVHIGHNARIGARTVIGALTCIGGSDKVGEDVWIGIGVTTANGISIGRRAKLLLNAVVAYDVPEGEMVSGFYAMPHRQWKRVYRKLRELTEDDE